MQKITWIKVLVLILFPLSLWGQADTSIQLLDKVVFYDGYASTVSEPVPTGVQRIDNTKYVVKLSEANKLLIKNSLTLKVEIGALCDNYDRLGGAFLHIVPKGDSLSSSGSERIEIGRFITPFMNKNKQPTQVDYSFDISHLAGAFTSVDFGSKHDFYFELFVFGVPYAANNEVAGCKGRNDVFQGSLFLVSSETGTAPADFYFEPIATYVDFNKYSQTDVPGTTTKIYTLTLKENLPQAMFHLITSNHGANANGEEYVRREHFVYFNDQEILKYTPGGKSCEPFRKFNTQGNGIYGPRAQSESWWAEWNNWCPGDVIPNRFIAVGDLEPGTYTFKITVPDAVFADNQGNFPLSLYMYSNYKPGTLSTHKVQQTNYSVYPNPSSDKVYIESSEELKKVYVLNQVGQSVLQTSLKELDFSNLSPGVYILNIEFANGTKTTEKIIKK